MQKNLVDTTCSIIRDMIFSSKRCAVLGALCAWLAFGSGAVAHEGHEHDKPPPLNLPIAPRVVAVTPEFELVGVRSGADRLTIFLHAFATGEPIADAELSLTVDNKTTVAEPAGTGVFDFSAPWIAVPGAHDITFNLTLPTGDDLMVGTLEIPAAPAAISNGSWASRILERPELIGVSLGGLALGVLLTLLVSGGRSKLAPQMPQTAVGSERAEDSQVRSLRRAGSLCFVFGLAFFTIADRAHAADAGPRPLPDIPSTMATDMPQRLPDATLFVPKATQHLLSLRTVVTAEVEAAHGIELTGAVIAAPNNIGRVQAGSPGRLEAGEQGLAYLGKKVRKGELLGYLVPYIEAFDRATIESQIAETEGRIAQQSAILKRYLELPGSVPAVKVDEVTGELDALRKRRAELLPSRVKREEIRAPIDGVISSSNASAGQIVDSRDVLFEIIDPSQFWVEAESHYPIDPGTFSSAIAVSGESKTYPLEFVGSGLILRHQATLLTFRISTSADGIAVGKPMKVILKSTVKEKGFVLPAAAVVRGSSGLPVVWIKTEPERFEPHPVKYEKIDGGNIVVTAGLKPDQRVVTEGVTLINQIR